MARMKFLCDADRCIECNACVTACKNEHEVPWGINRRRVVTINDGKPGERSVSMACMHLHRRALCGGLPGELLLHYGRRRRASLQGPVQRLRLLLLACPFGAPQYPKVGNFGSRGKMDKCTFCAGGPEPTAERRNTRSMVRTVLPRASCRLRRDRARPSRCSLATARSSPRSTRSGSTKRGLRSGPGAGRPLIARRSSPEVGIGSGCANIGRNTGVSCTVHSAGYRRLRVLADHLSVDALQRTTG